MLDSMLTLLSGSSGCAAWLVMSYNLMLDGACGTAAVIRAFSHYDVDLASCCPFTFTLLLKGSSNKESIDRFPCGPGGSFSSCVTARESSQI